MNLRLVLIAWLKSPIWITSEVRRSINQFPYRVAIEFFWARLIDSLQLGWDLTALRRRQMRTNNLSRVRARRVSKSPFLIDPWDALIVVESGAADFAIQESYESLSRVNPTPRSINFILPDGTPAAIPKFLEKDNFPVASGAHLFERNSISPSSGVLVLRAGVRPTVDSIFWLKLAADQSKAKGAELVVAYGDHIDTRQRRIVCLPRANLTLLKDNSYLKNMFLISNHELDSWSLLKFATYLLGMNRSSGAESLISNADQLIHVGKVLALAPQENHRQPKESERLSQFHSEPVVEIIIPTRDQSQVLGLCLESLFTKTKYVNFLVTLVDNGSVEPETHRLISKFRSLGMSVLVHNDAFNFSVLNNLVASKSTADFVCLLNNDIEIIDPDWLSKLVEASQKYHGALVGPLLLYPNGHVQHAGVRLDLWGSAGHVYSGLEPETKTDHDLLQSSCEVDALTAACLLIPTTLYKKLDGLDESFSVGLNDIDFCLRARLEGFICVYLPTARLIHHESVSRGGKLTSKKAAGLISEVLKFRLRYSNLRKLSYFENLNSSASATVAKKRQYFSVFGHLK